MNKRNLALLISKHPLLRKLTEDKTIPNSVVARLIVEELMEVQTKLLKSALAGIRRDFSENKQDKYINPETKQAVYPYEKLSELEEEEQVKYKNAVNKKVQAFLAQQNPETKTQGEKLEKQVDVAIDKEIQSDQSEESDVLEDLAFYMGLAAAPISFVPGVGQAAGTALSIGSDLITGANIISHISKGDTNTAVTKLMSIIGANIAAGLIPGGIAAKEGGEAAAKAAARTAGKAAFAKSAKFLSQKLGKEISEQAVRAAVEKVTKAAAKAGGSEIGRMISKKAQEQAEKINNDAELKKSIFVLGQDILGEAWSKFKGMFTNDDNAETESSPAVEKIASVIVDLNKQEEFLTTYDQDNLSLTLDFVKDNLPKEQVDVLKTAPPETQKKVVKAVAAELEKDQQENPFKELQGYSELNLKLPEEKVFIKFMSFLKEKELLKELSLRPLFTIIGRDKGMSEFVKSLPKDEKTIWRQVFGREDVQEFLKVNLKQMEKPQEPGKEEKPSTPMKGEPVAIDPAQAGAFVSAANELLNDFYNQKYRKNQAIIVGKVINSMKAFVEDADLALAFGKPPADKPEEQEATSEEPPKEQEATSEEPAPLEEQEGEEVKADKDEMRNIRIGLRSFLSRVNKTNKYLAEFEKVAADGSVLSDAYKKKFMDNLKEIQTAIYRLALVLNKMLDSKEELNEKKGSETINKWKEVQKLYDLSIKSVSSVKELLDTETPPDELDSTLTNDAYTALIDLAGHFPSVAPFGAGKMKRSDFGEYKTKFANAIGQVKSDLQNVFNLIKTGEAGEESLQNARDGLRDFGDAIASIFGVPSKFKDAKVKPGDDKAPAVQEDPEDTDDFPRDLTTQIKDLIDEYAEKYRKAKKVLELFNKNLNESIGDEFKEIKSELAKADKFVDIVTKNYAPMMRVGTKAGRKPEETKKMLIDQIRNFIEVYEELQGLYERAIQEPEEAKKPSWWKNLWPETLEKFNKLKDVMKELYSKFEDWLVGKGLDIDLDLQPGDIQDAKPSEPPEVEVEETFTEEIQEATSQIKKILPIDKFIQHADKKYYNTFIKLILIMYSKDQLSEEIKIGSISAPLAKAASAGMFNQQTLQEKLKSLLKNNNRLVSTISNMTRDIDTKSMKILLGIIAANKSNIVSLDFDAIASKDFTDLKKDSERSLDLDGETDDSLLDSDDILDAEEQQAIQKTAKKVVKDLSQKRPDIADDDLIAQAIEDILGTPEISNMVDGEKEEKEAEEKAKEAVEQAISPDKAEDSSEEKKAEEVAVETIESVKKENPITKPEEVIQRAAETIESDDSFGPQFDREAAMEIAKAAFIDWVPGIRQQAKDQKQKAGIPTDIKYLMKNDSFAFPGFNEFNPKEQNAISIFISYVSPDFDPANIDLNEETTAEKAFAGLLQKYVDTELVRPMLKLMEKNKVLKTFKELMGNKDNKGKILTYVSFFKDIGEEPEDATASKIDKVMEMAKKMVDKTVGDKIIKSISVNEVKKTDDQFSKTGIEHKELSVFPEAATGDFKGLMQEVGPEKLYNGLREHNINPEKPFVYVEFTNGATEVHSVEKFLSNPPKVKEESLQEQLANKLKPLIKEMLTKGK